MNISLLSGVLALLAGLIYTLQAYNLPKATIGNPMAPALFPLALGILMSLLGVSQILQESKKMKAQGDAYAKGEKDQHLKSIFITSAICIVYALLFNRIGFVLSTIIFLEGILFVYNGKNNWKMNTIVSLSFSIGIYIIFSKFLGVILPVMPFLYI